MPKGVHFGRKVTRHYTRDYFKLPASTFRSMLNAQLGHYSIPALETAYGTLAFELRSSVNYDLDMIMNVGGPNFLISLNLDDRSASTKLYLICPHCQKQRQWLYIVKDVVSCRVCFGLKHASQSEGIKGKLARKIIKLRAKIWGKKTKGPHDLFQSSALWPKPKFMRWDVFFTQKSELLTLESKFFNLFAVQINKFSNIDLGIKPFN